MTTTIQAAARFICECSGWKLSNLQVQKILYLADMVHFGRTGRRLTTTGYEAWDYGPVSPELYQKLKGFGAKPIPQSAFWAVSDTIEPEDQAILREACDHLALKSGANLIANTHWERGAWAKRYVPRANVRITEQDMLDEYRQRTPDEGHRAA